MYSRYPNYRFSGGVRVPDNYSGNAFKPADESQGENEEAVAEVISSVSETNEGSDTRESLSDMSESAESAPVLKSVAGKPRFPSFRFNLGRIFSGGFGFEELLIIGLILLIAQSGTDDDIILLLALLLFIG